MKARLALVAAVGLAMLPADYGQLNQIECIANGFAWKWTSGSGVAGGRCVLPASAHAQGPALILTPDPGEVTFTLSGLPVNVPPYRIGVDAQGQEWDARSGTPWVSVTVQGNDLYLSVTPEAWDLGPGILHCATVALLARKRDDLGASTAAAADSARVNVCVVRSR